MVPRDESALRLVVNRARTCRSGAIHAKSFGSLGKATPAFVLIYALQGLPE